MSIYILTLNGNDYSHYLLLCDHPEVVIEREDVNNEKNEKERARWNCTL